MERKRILIVVDHKWRDLPGHSLLASCLKKKYGHDVRLARVDVMAAHVYPFKPHMVVMPNLFGPVREEFAARMAAQSMHVAVLPTEGIAYNDESTEFLAHRWTDVSNMGLYLAWSPCVADAIDRHNVMPAEKVKVVGCTRFDFHRPPFRSLAKSRTEFVADHGLNPDWPIVVWASNYVYGSFMDKNTEFCLNMAKTFGVRNVSGYRGLETIKFDHEDRERAISAVTEFLGKVRKINFVIKPHPGEHIERYRTLLDGINTSDNCVKVISGEYIEDVLNSADVFVQRLSTSCVDAWCAGVETVELLMMESYDDYVVNTEYADGSRCASSGDELYNAVEDILHGSGPSETVKTRRAEAIGHLCYRADGRSYMRTAEAIHEFIETHPNEPRMKWDKWQMRWGAEGAVKTMLRLPQNLKAREILKKYLLRRDVKDYLGRFDKIVTDDAIDRWMNHWNAVLDADGEVRTCAEEHVA